MRDKKGLQNRVGRRVTIGERCGRCREYGGRDEWKGSRSTKNEQKGNEGVKGGKRRKWMTGRVCKRKEGRDGGRV